ncbi:hypothetical protein [Streptomyces sp. ODS28]|uniref:hypothetical protein n=1 Tax=Streptomyces sp. ODS28 TaxID=3136688 RepID=UPI0031ED3974
MYRVVRRSAVATALALALGAAGLITAASPASAGAKTCPLALTQAKEANDDALLFDRQSMFDKAERENEHALLSLADASAFCEGVLTGDAYKAIGEAQNSEELAWKANGDSNLLQVMATEDAARGSIQTALNAVTA